MNIPTLIVGLIAAGIVYLLIRSLVKAKKTGGCGCGCSSCSGSCPHCITPVLKKGEKS